MSQVGLMAILLPPSTKLCANMPKIHFTILFMSFYFLSHLLPHIKNYYSSKLFILIHSTYCSEIKLVQTLAINGIRKLEKLIQFQVILGIISFCNYLYHILKLNYIAKYVFSTGSFGVHVKLYFQLDV